MTFTRHEVCALAGIPVERFKTLARRDQLPVNENHGSKPSLSQEIHEKLAETSWNRFTAYEVFLIAVHDRLACQIGYADGVSYETASKMIWNNNLALENAFKSGIKYRFRGRKGIRTKPDDIWFGYMGDISVNGQTGGVNTSIYEGNLVDIAERASSSRASFMRLYVVNASFVLREVLQRADQLSISFF